MQFRLLGNVAAEHDGVLVALGRRRERCLLGLLLLEAGAAVPADRLVTLLWDDEPPPTARASLHTNISRLRRMLDPDDDGALGVRLISRREGYVAEVDPQAVDVHRFRALVDAAMGGKGADRAALLRQALELWRGPFLADVASPRLRERVGAPLAALRMTALEEWAEAELSNGLGQQLIGELSALVAEHPLHERFAAQLMRALYQAGRPADALLAFQSTRRVLADELGTDPSRELQDLHREILRASAPVEVVPAAGDGPGRSDLPGDLAAFTGRQRELRELIDAAVTTQGVVVLAIDGMAGIGKTALAVHAAHRLAPRYPDAQLFIDLNAHAAGQRPIAPEAALGSLLRAWGAAPDTVPDGLAERAARWRAELAGRRVLLVLDNAANAAQVRPLLPGGAHCLVLVTSRHKLTDLDVTGVLSLSVLPPGDAAALFAEVAGAGRVGDDPAAVAEVARLCGHLPLAIRIAAARLRSRPAWRLADLAGRLSDEQRRLSELAAGDRSVAGAFLLSYEYLSATQQRLFRLLGLVPGPDFDIHVAAALAGSGLTETEDDLDHLFDAHLLEQVAPDRYRFHDLLRDFAHEMSHRPEFEPERGPATERMLDYYLHVAATATEPLDPRGQRITARLRFAPAHTPAISDQAGAIGWYEAEQSNLIAAVRFAASHGWPDYVWQTADLLWYFLRTRGRHREAIGLLRVALAAAGELGDQRAQAETLRLLGNSHQNLSLYADALRCHQQALALFQALGDRSGEAAATANLGVVCERLGRYPESLEHYRRSLATRRELGDLWGEASTLTFLGVVHDHLGEYAEALASYRDALALRRKVNDRRGEGAVLTCAGMTLDRLGRLDEALDHHQQALELMRAAADRQGEAAALGNLGTVYHHMGDYPRALDYRERCLTLLREVGDRNSESEVLNDIGETYRALGNREQSLTHHRAALALARQVGVRPQQARAHDGIAGTVREDDAGAAREHWRQALDIYTAIGVPEADRVARELADLDASA